MDKSKIEHIHIKHRFNKKISDYEADYNGVIAHGDTAINAYKNAKKKHDLLQVSNMLDIVQADFQKTLENVRV